MVVFASDQAHAIIKKACMVLGIGHFCAVATTAEENFSLTPSVLQAAVERELALGRVPIVCVATTGTTSSCAFDSLTDIATVLQNIPGLDSIWVHVDAAYGAWIWFSVTVYAADMLSFML
jgi:aromatic-L-amino-acid decarboxylase